MLIDDAVSKKENITKRGKLDAFEILSNLASGDHKPLFKHSPYRVALQSFDRAREDTLLELKLNGSHHHQFMFDQ